MSPLAWILSLLLLSPALASAEASVAAPDPCAQLSWNYADTVEAQGLWGLTTPSAHWTLVRDATAHLSKGGDGGIGNENYQYTDDFIYPFGDEFREFCARLVEHEIKHVTLVCKAGVRDSSKCLDHEAGIIAERCDRYEKAGVNVECAISPSQGAADWRYDNFYPSMLGTPGRAVFETEQDSDFLRDLATRKRLYSMALRQTIDTYVRQYRPSKEEAQRLYWENFYRLHPELTPTVK